MFLTNGEKNLSFFSISKLSSESNSSFFNKSIEGILAISRSLIISSASSMINSLSFSLETIFISLLSSIDVSISAITSPTLTISFTSKFFLTSLPLNSDGTSESTLSVAISTIDSSISTLSPTSFNQLVIVASAMLSPIFGSFKRYFPIFIVIANLQY